MTHNLHWLSFFSNNVKCRLNKKRRLSITKGAVALNSIHCGYTVGPVKIYSIFKKTKNFLIHGISALSMLREIETKPLVLITDPQTGKVLAAFCRDPSGEGDRPEMGRRFVDRSERREPRSGEGGGLVYQG